MIRILHFLFGKKYQLFINGKYMTHFYGEYRTKKGAMRTVKKEFKKTGKSVAYRIERM